MAHRFVRRNRASGLLVDPLTVWTAQPVGPRFPMEVAMTVRSLKPRRSSSPAVVADMPSHDEISVRAYALYEARGASHGDDLDDWLEAEHELLQERSDRIFDIAPEDD